MGDLDFWWYIIAAVIYFLTRSKKKKRTSSGRSDQPRPGTENSPPQPSSSKTFDELLREVTGETQLGLPRPIEQTPIEIAKEEKQKEEVEDSFRLEGERRAFADDESRKIYEASIKQAAGYDIKFQPDEHFKESGLFEKGKQASGVGEEEYTIADEIRDGFSSDEARKAIIYSEILNRRY